MKECYLKGYGYDEKKIKGYRLILWFALTFAVVLLVAASYLAVYKTVPNRLVIREGEEERFHFVVPVSASIYEEAVPVSGFSKEQEINGVVTEKKTGIIEVMSTNTLVMKANRQNDYRMDLKLFGVIPLKTVNLEIIEDTKVYPVGLPIGIYVKTNGSMVVGISDFRSCDGSKAEPAKHILKEGDYILKVNEEELEGKKDLIRKIRKSGGEDLIFTVVRNHEVIRMRCKPVLADDGEYKMGIWIRDSAQGIGTMTYLDERGNFGALGHGINDVDTNTLMDLDYGGIYKTDIVGVQRGKSGAPGELTGVIDFEDENLLGNVKRNTKGGIFGQLSSGAASGLSLTGVEIGLKQEIVIGKAGIMCKIGDTNKIYEVEIVKINYDSEDDNRGIVLKITDKELLKLTGGIVQGMSGAPILQNGRMIGAVTHVLINDSTKGYGIFAENMLAQNG